MSDYPRHLRAETLLVASACGLATLAWHSAGLAQEQQHTGPSPELRQLLARGDVAAAIELATAGLRENPHDRELRLIRASAFDALRSHDEALADYDVLLRDGPASASVHHLRGRSRFKRGDVDGSIADFDRAIELEPSFEMRLWERGISLYYAERYAEGARQFEAYQRYDASDVENVVWRFLCQSRAEGVESARAAILPLDRDDPRVPMMTIYALYRGPATPDEVLAAARDGDPSADQLRHRLFYAHLYIGLYFEAASQATEARIHLRRAHEHKISHYMWDVADVHLKKRGWIADERREE